MFSTELTHRLRWTDNFRRYGAATEICSEDCFSGLSLSLSLSVITEPYASTPPAPHSVIGMLLSLPVLCFQLIRTFTI